MSLIRPPLLIRLVRLAPVLSSTATLALALAEYQSLLPWFALPLQNLKVEEHLSIWLNTWFKPSLATVLVLGVASTNGAKNAVVSLYTGTVTGGGSGLGLGLGLAVPIKGSFTMARVLYTCGACLTIAHFAFSSPFRKCVRRLVHGGPALNTRHELLRWLELHTIRTLTTDLPAWLCFVGAFLSTL